MDSAQLSKAFNEKLDKLIAKYSESKKIIAALTVSENDLKQELKNKEQEIENLKRQLQTKDLAKTFLVAEGNTKEAKSKINKIVREIDDCIALLNR